MRYRVSHVTRYSYDANVKASFGQVHQLPGDLDGQRCLERWLVTEPDPDTFRERVDYFGNGVVYFSIREPHEELVVRSSSLVDTSGRPTLFGPGGEQPWEVVRDRSAGPEMTEFLTDSPLVERSAELERYASPSFRAGAGLGDAVSHLVHRINSDFEYLPGSTDVTTTVPEVMQTKKGVCQDFSHLLVGCLRSIGLPVRYVSGYLETDPGPGVERLWGSDRTHAWVAVYTGTDWIGIDPTNDQIAGPRYVTTSHGRDYSDVPPFKGVVYTEATVTNLYVHVDVEGLTE